MNRFAFQFLAGLAASLLVFGNVSAAAQTKIEQVAFEAPDGNLVTGFVYQDINTQEGAPLAILMHGMGGTSLSWLANDQAFYVDNVTRDLIAQGYRVAALDARSHGVRRDELSPLERLQRVRAGEAAPYLAMINGTVQDYSVLLDNLNERFGKPDHLVVIGYSMGAQTAVLFAAQNQDVSHIVTMVPPGASSAPSVSPVNHAGKVYAEWLLITASRDQFSTAAENTALLIAAGRGVTHLEFDSGHRLPSDYTAAVADWIAAIGQ
jgi:pimeloyl-ACP methyl ester carboxylesterase